MSVLSDRDIFKAIQDKQLVIENYDFWSVRSNHYDLKLGNTFHVAGPRRYMRYAHVDTRKPIPDDLMATIHVADDEPFTMLPGDFVIVTTKESMGFDGEFMGILTGRSSIGRLGVKVHSTAAHFDRGFRGFPNLEMSLDAPWSIDLYPGTRIASMIFHQLSSECITPYNNQADAKYQNQGETPMMSQLWKDYETVPVASGALTS